MSLKAYAVNKYDNAAIDAPLSASPTWAISIFEIAASDPKAIPRALIGEFALGANGNLIPNRASNGYPTYTLVAPGLSGLS